MTSETLPAQSVAMMWRSTVNVPGHAYATVSSNAVTTGATSQSSEADTSAASNSGNVQLTVMSAG